MNDSNDSSDLLALFAALCDGEITPAQGERLKETLREDPAARLLYVRYMDIHASLSTTGVASIAEYTDLLPADCAADQGHGASLSDSPLIKSLDGLDSEVTETSPSVRDIRPSQLVEVHTSQGGSGRSSFRQAATLAITICVALALGVMLFGPRETEPLGAPAEIAYVAKFISVEKCSWGGVEQGGIDEELVAGQRLKLTSGVAKLQFRSGATVLIESPSVFELISPTALQLETGTVAVRAGGPVKEFRVISRGATIADLGTSFGVHCDRFGTTEVEVFEGAVELRSNQSPDACQILKLGESARVDENGKNTNEEPGGSNQNRFAVLLEILWDDIHSDSSSLDDGVETSIVRAEFSDAPVAGRVDTFYGATVGQGWRTPWMAYGNPLGEIRRDHPLSGEGNQYLCTRFYRSYTRVIAREYGSSGKFDPERPHVISWRWRYDGTLDGFGDSFNNRVLIYANPYFRRGSFLDNSWLLGVVGDNEEIGQHRRVHPNQWFVYDGAKGEAFQRECMINTGMSLKANVVYRFAVVVYPQRAQYDVAIQDDEEIYTRTGLTFRSKSSTPSQMLHFSLRSNDKSSDAAFSLDSLRIESLEDTGLSSEDPLPHDGNLSEAISSPTN